VCERVLKVENCPSAAWAVTYSCMQCVCVFVYVFVYVSVRVCVL